MKKILKDIEWWFDYYIMCMLYNGNKTHEYINYMEKKWGYKTKIMKINQLDNSYLKVKKFDHHRNGISGLGFYVVIFDWNEPGEKQTNMTAFVFDEQGAIAITKNSELIKHNIEMNNGNSWRGDYFESAIRKFIKKTNKQA